MTNSINTVSDASETSTTAISTIDAAIAKAKARKASGETVTRLPRKEKPTDEAKALIKAEKDAAKEIAKAARDEHRALKKTARELKLAAKGDILPGTSRLNTAQAKLPELNDTTSETIANVFATNPSETDLVTIIAHLQHNLRARQTIKAAQGVALTVGQSVTLIAGEPRFIGQVGTVVKVSRLRCHIALEGREKCLYVFTSDVTPNTVTEETTETVEATGTDG